jgi:threonine dehydrogenase-like Zn-dependent dehydrogenase
MDVQLVETRRFEEKVSPPKSMRAVVLRGNQEISLEETAMPEPGPGEVRIKMEGCGICASNLPVWEGRPWFDYPRPPGDPGHEGWGTVDAVGPGVRHLVEGDRVTLLSYAAFAEYDLAPASHAHKLPPVLAGLPVPGEPLGCAVNIFRRSAIAPGQTVAVVGIGFLGALLVQMASQLGARVIGLSRRPFALEVAQRCGAEATVSFEDRDAALAAVSDFSGGEGCHCVIEATGKQEPLDLAGELTQVRGRLVIAGYHQDGPRQVNMQLWNWRGLDVINAHERDPQLYLNGIEAAVGELAESRLDPAPLYTHIYPLDQIQEAFVAARERPEGFMKALVRLSSCNAG